MELQLVRRLTKKKIQPSEGPLSKTEVCSDFGFINRLLSVEKEHNLFFTSMHHFEQSFSRPQNIL